MTFIKDITNFFSYLTFVDIIFFIAIIILLILIVTLIYFIKINNDVLGEDDFFPIDNSKNKDKLDKVDKIANITIEEPKVEKEEYNDEEEELLDLEGLTKKLQEQKYANKEAMSISAYEQDQEEKAIISYDELLQKQNKYAINYEKEEVLDDLVVKKVNLHDLVNKNIKEEISGVRVISYEKEEAFLNALKQLNNLLN